jgi:hypothetical protein
MPFPRATSALASGSSELQLPLVAERQAIVGPDRGTNASSNAWM